jgi:DNA-directed RNA polymerase III subunit RPC8
MVAEFRMTVFRPFVGEVLSGRIMAATHNGIRISLEFFDDIFIPAHLIFSVANLYCFRCVEFTENSDHGTQSWRLPVSATEYNYLEKDDTIRFKVEEESFKEATPAPPRAHGSGDMEHRVEDHKEPIYSLIVFHFMLGLILGELSGRWTRSGCMVGRLGYPLHSDSVGIFDL